MLTVSWRRKRRVPPRRGRGAILGLVFCCAQCSILAVAVSIGSAVLCRCDNREAIEFGRSVGIRTFQGRYIENLIAEDERRRDLLRLKRRIERADQALEEETGGR